MRCSSGPAANVLRGRGFNDNSTNASATKSVLVDSSSQNCKTYNYEAAGCFGINRPRLPLWLLHPTASD